MEKAIVYSNNVLGCMVSGVGASFAAFVGFPCAAAMLAV